MKLKFVIIIILLSGIFLALDASASAIKVTPLSINFEVVPGKTGQKAITIENPGGDVALFEAYPDDFSAQISVNPASFILNPGEKKEVLISANLKKEGVYAAFLSVVSKPLSQRKFETNAGVKVPFEIRVSKNLKGLLDDQQDLIYILIIILILVFSGFLWQKKRRQKNIN